MPMLMECPDRSYQREVFLDYRGLTTTKGQHESVGSVPYFGECVENRCIAYDNDKKYCNKYKKSIEVESRAMERAGLGDEEVEI